MTNNKKQEYCLICKRLLDNPADPLSGNCGGDCWGCVGAIEAEMGCEESLAYVRKNMRQDFDLAGSIHLSPDLAAALPPLRIGRTRL